MQEIDGELVVSPTDLVRALTCRHLTRLDHEVARGLRPKPAQTDEALEILFARGLDHERRFLERLRDEGRVIREISVDGTGRAALEAAERATRQAISEGVDVVYQATFFDGQWRGHADFLLKRPDRPGRWPWSYDIADTKLARRLKVAALLQMAIYADRLAQLQGIAPERLIVVTGDGEQRAFRYADCAAYTQLVREDFLRVLAAAEPTRPEPVKHCDQCRWLAQCRAQWRSEDHLSLVAQMRRDHARSLREAGISTVRQLGSLDPAQLPLTIGEASRERLTQQARLQLKERDTGRPAYELLPPLPGRGLALLPEPSAGDVFFDIEGDPFVGDHGLEYLFGLLDADGFTAYWATDPGDEKRAFEELVDHLMRAWARDPDMHIYHYAPYEPSRLKALSGRHATRTAEVDRLLRGQRLVDLYAVVRQGLRVSKESYSIKKLESFYWGHLRHGEGVSDALGSVIAFERWLLDRDEALLEDIRAYNEVDCRSTQALRDWLEARRVEGGGDNAYPRPQHGDGAPTEAAQDTADEIAALTRRLLAPLPGEGRTESDDAQALLAGLLDWHRRESLPEWWDYFRRLELTDDELVDDSAAVGLLGNPSPAGALARSQLWRMTFPPQETKLGPGDTTYINPVSGKGEGTVVDIAADEGWLLLKRGPRRGAPTCTALVPGTPILDRDQRARLRDLATWVLHHGIDSGQPGWQAARNLLLRRPPGGVQGPGGSLRQEGEAAAEAVCRLALDLGSGVLPVQGPPGTGKTFTGARMILRLLAAGKRVGICAFSHRAIGNLLDEVCRAAEEQGMPIRAMQKADEYQRCTSEQVAVTSEARDVEAALAGRGIDLVAGTAWLYAREPMQGTLDVLVVDEAGQLSLANVLAISGAATGMVLLGDPQQLAQPVKGLHPRGAAASALDHLLAGGSTISPDRGVLLDTTWRMHPRVAQFVSQVSYDGRLGVAPGRERQLVDAPSPLAGAGLRYVPVQHTSNSAVSPEEAEVVGDLVVGLVGMGTWTDAAGQARPLTAADILVLTPYNAQVNMIRSVLRDHTRLGLRVGTVDKHQGQEAPVVIYSMASSSLADAPRGVDFLYSLNRFNVAVSRARSVCALVCSPTLLTPVVAKPERIRPVNALCRFVLDAETVSLDALPAA